MGTSTKGPRVHDFPAIMAEILRGYTLPILGDHGVIHWARVYENGMRIAETTEVDEEVVALFALFHDSRRVNEFRDDDHGWRGGELARSLRGRLVHLDDSRFELLFEACRRHTEGVTSDNLTLATCWDADRLDLGRVEIMPSRKRLGTAAARELLEWADERARGGYVPRKVLKGWGITI